MGMNVTHFGTETLKARLGLRKTSDTSRPVMGKRTNGADPENDEMASGLPKDDEYHESRRID
jgi:hypothetical protein